MFYQIRFSPIHILVSEAISDSEETTLSWILILSCVGDKPCCFRCRCSFWLHLNYTKKVL